jgi:choloylglycine hydrolase
MPAPLRNFAAGCILTCLSVGSVANACTGISLEAKDGATVVARTVEWALSDADHDTLVLFPRNHVYEGQTPDGYNGLTWTGRHGFVSLSAYGQPYGPDGMNEAGLYVGMYYFPDFASFSEYDPTMADRSLSVGDFMRWMLSNFATVAEVRANIDSVRVVNVDDPRFGGAALPFHWKIADPSGDSIVIEITNGGNVQVFDSFLGVITNSPGYDWHLTNLRNYLGLSPVAELPMELDGTVFAPLGAGTGLRGMPGDFTPPSRFVRAVALTASARPLATGNDAVFEAFRILDSFNIPVGSTGAADRIATDIESATQITTAADLDNRLFYFHTMSDRQVRLLDLGTIDFDTIEMQMITAGASTTQTVREIVPVQ